MTRLLPRFVLLSFRRFHSLEYRYQRRFSPLGKMLTLGLLLSAIFGVDTRTTLIFQLFALFASLLLVSALTIPFFKPRFRVKRVLPRFVTVDRPFEYTIRVENLSAKPYYDLKVLDNQKDPRPDLETFLNSREPGGEERNWFDRKTAYHRFAWLCRIGSGLALKSGEIPLIHPEESVTVRLQATPGNRGLFQLESTTLAREDPLGLIRSFITIPAPQTVLVLPKRYPLPPDLKIRGNRRYQSGGEGLAGGVGDSEEFVGLRDYRDGDSPRHIHWPSWAKSGRPVVKEYQEEYFTRHGLILDTHGEVSRDLFEEAVSLAATVSVEKRPNDLLLDILFISRQVFRLTVGRGMGEVSQVLEALASVQPAPKTPFDDLANLVLNQTHTLSGLLLILIHWDESRQGLIRKLQARGVHVSVWLMVESRGDYPELERDPFVGEVLVRMIEVGAVQLDLAGGLK
jgi:uncharacterized protein (DUF58 family)